MAAEARLAHATAGRRGWLLPVVVIAALVVYPLVVPPTC
jgi:hypothetical protein